ncbi:nucleotidyltransferase family protein [Pelotomaculum propionicicum]|uniref:nucleotidyltransferase domain-containing protein n=1 Tax=Pelotomaculum propionicicum TaxID=258475 RepID=UPI003B79DE37
MLKKLIGKFPPELLLVLASADGDLDKTKYLLQQPINWDNFLRLADRHSVYPSVYKTFSCSDNDLVPGNVLNVLKQMCQDNTMNTLRVTGETIRLGSLLEKSNINTVVLKGTPLSWRLYGDIATRPYGDIDILVAADKLEQSITILINEGYRKITECDSYDLTPRQKQIYLKNREHSSHFRYWNNEKEVILEIHWRLSKYSNVLPFADGSIKEMVVAGSPVKVLSDEEWLLYLVLHGAGHKWHRLRWLLDINKFIQQENIDLVSLNHLAEKYNVRLFLHQAMILVNQVFKAPLPSDLEIGTTTDRTAWRLAALALQDLISEFCNKAGSSGIYSVFMDNLYGLYMSRGLINKFNYVLKLFGPTVEDIKRVTLPDKLYTLYYIIKPFAFIARRMRRLLARKKYT